MHKINSYKIKRKKLNFPIGIVFSLDREPFNG